MGGCHAAGLSLILPRSIIHYGKLHWEKPLNFISSNVLILDALTDKSSIHFILERDVADHLIDVDPFFVASSTTQDKAHHQSIVLIEVAENRGEKARFVTAMNQVISHAINSVNLPPNSVFMSLDQPIKRSGNSHAFVYRVCSV